MWSSTPLVEVVQKLAISDRILPRRHAAKEKSITRTPLCEVGRPVVPFVCMANQAETHHASFASPKLVSAAASTPPLATGPGGGGSPGAAPQAYPIVLHASATEEPQEESNWKRGEKTRDPCHPRPPSFTCTAALGRGGGRTSHFF